MITKQLFVPLLAHLIGAFLLAMGFIPCFSMAIRPFEPFLICSVSLCCTLLFNNTKFGKHYYTHASLTKKLLVAVAVAVVFWSGVFAVVSYTRTAWHGSYLTYDQISRAWYK
jgi:hypothetical protein